MAGSVTLYAQWSTNAKPTTTSLVVSRSSVTYGDESVETFTVTVEGAGAVLPTGTVTLKSSSTTLCSTSTLHQKTADTVTASCDLTNIELGAHSYSVTAFFSSSAANYAGSNSSGAQSFTVTKDATTTTVSVSPSFGIFSFDTLTIAVTVATHDHVAVPDGDTVAVHVGTYMFDVTLCRRHRFLHHHDIDVRVFRNVTATYNGDPELDTSNGSLATLYV